MSWRGRGRGGKGKGGKEGREEGGRGEEGENLCNIGAWVVGGAGVCKYVVEKRVIEGGRVELDKCLIVIFVRCIFSVFFSGEVCCCK